MNTTSYAMLCNELEQVAYQVFNEPETPCDFSDDQDVVEFEAEFNIFEGRD